MGMERCACCFLFVVKFCFVSLVLLKVYTYQLYSLVSTFSVKAVKFVCYTFSTLICNINKS